MKNRTTKAATKTVDGVQFPASAFAYTPDLDLSSKWKLRLYDTPEDAKTGKPSVRLTAAAVMALSPSGFRGNRVQLPKEALAGVKRRVADAWIKARRQGGRDVSRADLPSVLTKLESPAGSLAEAPEIEVVVPGHLKIEIEFESPEIAAAFSRLSNSTGPLGRLLQTVAEGLLEIDSSTDAPGEVDESYSVMDAIEDIEIVSESGNAEMEKVFSGAYEKLSMLFASTQTRKQESFIPPKGVADAAKQGLKYREEFGRGGTRVGLARANQLANREPVSADTIMRMVSFFARHGGQNANDPPSAGEEPDNGYIAWLLWGGDPGKRWVETIRDRIIGAEKGDLSSADLAEGGALQPAQGMTAEEREKFTQFRATMQVLKADEEEERTVFGIVLEPEFIDSQSDIYSEEEIRQTAFKFMERYQQFGLQHQTMLTSILPLESYLAPVDLEIEGQKIKKGTWLLRVRVLDDDIWSRVKSGELTGFSIGGSAIRTPELV